MMMIIMMMMIMMMIIIIIIISRSSCSGILKVAEVTVVGRGWKNTAEWKKHQDDEKTEREDTIRDSIQKGKR